MGGNINADKPVRSENESFIRRDNGSVVLRKERVFTDGSRIVEESFIEGSEMLENMEAAIPLVPANVYSGGSGERATATGDDRATTKPGEMLQPAYNPDGNLIGVAAMMFVRYGGCSFCLWILFRILARAATNNSDDDAWGSTYGYSYQDDYWN